MAVPVVLVTAGARPVTAVESGGFPMTPVDTLGEPVTLVDAGGEPITLINEDGSPAFLAYSAKAYLNGIAPYHWFDFVNDRCLYASNDVGAVSGATGYSFSRASTGYYENADGTLTSFASGALRRGNRGVLIEGARTNLLLRSTLEGGGAAPTGWTQPVATGTSAPTTSTLNPAIVAYSQTATAERPMLAQSFSLVSNTTYVFSVYVEEVTGTVTLASFLNVNAVPSGATLTEDGLGNLASGQRRWFVISGTYTGVSTQFRVGLGANANTTGTVRFSAPQLETAAFPSSYIPTTTASATRAADVLTCTAGVSYPASLWSEINRIGTLAFTNIAMQVDSGSNNERAILGSTAGDLATAIQITGGSTVATPTVAGAMALNTTYKIASRFQTNNCNVAQGGVLGTNDTTCAEPAASTALRFGSDVAGGGVFFGYIRRAAIIQGAGTNADLTGMTT